jgi:hypothetical protein
MGSSETIWHFHVFLLQLAVGSFCNKLLYFKICIDIFCQVVHDTVKRHAFMMMVINLCVPKQQQQSEMFIALGTYLQ